MPPIEISFSNVWRWSCRRMSAPNARLPTPCWSATTPFRRLCAGSGRRPGAPALHACARGGIRRRSSHDPPESARYDRPMPERLYFTESDEANAMIASDPLALLVGFVLDQQVTVQQLFPVPLLLRERLGSSDAPTLASAELEPVFRAKPAIHR